MASQQIQIPHSARQCVCIHISVWNVPNLSVFWVSFDTSKLNHIIRFLFSSHPLKWCISNVSSMKSQCMFNIETIKKIIMRKFQQWQVNCTLFILICFINTSVDWSISWILHNLDAYILYIIYYITYDL